MGNVESAKNFGSAALLTDDIRAVFIKGSSAEELEQALDLASAAIAAEARNVIDLSLGGGGKGNVFLLTVTSGPAGTGPDELYWALYGASSEPELEKAAEVAKQRVLANGPSSTLIGQTVVGGAHGAPFCGLLLSGAR